MISQVCPDGQTMSWTLSVMADPVYVTVTPFEIALSDPVAAPAGDELNRANEDTTNAAAATRRVGRRNRDILGLSGSFMVRNGLGRNILTIVGSLIQSSPLPCPPTP